jgi:hypothetical protein
MVHKEKIYKIALSVTLLAVLTACASRYETTLVDAKIIDKEYDKAETKTKEYKDSAGKIQTKTEKIPEEWEITVDYNGIQKEFEFSNSDFYDSVQVGQTMQVELKTGFDKNDVVVSEALQLP